MKDLNYKLHEAFLDGASINEITTSASSGSFEGRSGFVKSKFFDINENFIKYEKENLAEGDEKTKPALPGGKFVKIKDKCSTFPYCNLGSDAIIVSKSAAKEIYEACGKNKDKVNDLMNEIVNECNNKNQEIMNENKNLKSLQKDNKKNSDTENKEFYNKISELYKDIESSEGKDFKNPKRNIGKNQQIDETDDIPEEVAKRELNSVGLEGIVPDTEPGKKYKDRAEKAIKGDSTMGNLSEIEGEMDGNEDYLERAKRNAKAVIDEPGVELIGDVPVPGSSKRKGNGNKTVFNESNTFNYDKLNDDTTIEDIKSILSEEVINNKVSFIVENSNFELVFCWDGDNIILDEKRDKSSLNESIDLMNRFINYNRYE